MVEGLFSLLFYCENGIDQYAVLKTLTYVFGGESVITWALYVVLPYHLSQRISLVLSSVQYMKKSKLLKIKRTTDRAESVKVSFRGLSVKSNFFAIMYFNNSYITEEKTNDLDKLLYLCYLVVLLR